MASDFLSHNITIIGGDYRQFLLYEDFVQRGFSVSGIALQNNTFPDTQKEAEVHAESICSITTLLPSDVWITGIPFTKDHVHIYSENPNCMITLEYFFRFLTQHPPKMLIGGHFTKELIDFSREYQIPCHDLLKCDAIAIENAIPTAEGAIYYAMGLSPITLHKSNCLVLGFGKCAKPLAAKLKGLDANVTVCARKKTDLAQIASCGYTPLSLEQLDTKLYQFSFIFNTIPAMILNRSRIATLSSNVAIVDIASVPGGIDQDAAKEFDIPFKHALGIPGKLSPKTAADILAEQILLLLAAL